jgi:cytochrome c biogenesis protein CcmG/thiol:disulfide interchange protein DsbE
VEMVGEALPEYDRDAPVDAAVGMASPVVTGEEFDGSPITIGGASEGPSMLVFLAHWCPHCNAEIPELIELEDAGEIPEDLNVIGISTAVASDRPNYPPSEWIVEKGWPWPTMADDEQASAFIDFGGAGFPFLLILDTDGTVLARQSGESSSEQIEAWIDATLATAA